MANSSGEITAPVSIYDVQQVLGTSDNDVGTLCKKNNVNKWAKYKPVIRQNLIDTMSQLNADKTWKSTATWWKADDSKCGLSYISQSTIGDVKANIDSKHAVWARVAPTGGTAAPYRLIDFNHYHHNAFPPTYALSATSAQMRAGETLKIVVNTSSDDGYSIRFSHLGVFNNYYYTAAVYDMNGNLKFIFSAPKKVSQYIDGENIEIEVPFSNTQTGGYSGILAENQTYKAYVFISSHNYDTVVTSPAAGDNTYIPMPCGEGDYGMQPTEFRCVKDLQWANVTAYCPLNGQYVSWTVELYGAGTPSNTTLRLIYLDGTPVGTTGSSITLDFTTGATAITSGDGQVNGWRKTSTPLTYLQLPAANPNPELYMVEFVSQNISGRAMIGQEINPNT